MKQVLFALLVLTTGQLASAGMMGDETSPTSGHNIYFLRYSCVTVENRVFELYQGIDSDRWSVSSRDPNAKMGGYTLGVRGAGLEKNGALTIENKIGFFKIDLLSEQILPPINPAVPLKVHKFKGMVAGFSEDLEAGKGIPLDCTYVN